MNSVVEPVGTIELVENQVEISAVPQFVTDRLTVLGSPPTCLTVTVT